MPAVVLGDTLLLLFLGMKSKQGLPKVVGLLLQNCPTHPSLKKKKKEQKQVFGGATACAL